MRWQEQAACRDMNVSVFFPDNYSGILKAKKVCAECAVRERCLDWALSHPMAEDRGVFGGTTHKERGKIRDSLIRLRFPV